MTARSFSGMYTTVLADCPECQREVDARIVDCDPCFEKFQDQGGNPNDYDELQHCEHLVCTVCEEPLSP